MISFQQLSKTLGSSVGAITKGNTRDVYLFENPVYIIKVARKGLFRANWYEWAIWNTCQALHPWLAPAVALSPDWEKLIMVRGIPTFKVPNNLPVWMYDANPHN